MENQSNMKWTLGLFKAASAMLRAFRAHLVAFGGSDAQAGLSVKGRKGLRLTYVKRSGFRA